MQHVCAVWHLLVVVLTPGNHYSVFLLSVLICCSHIQGSLYFFFFFFFVRARRSGDDDLTVMEAVPMYHVCSFHKRLQAQLIPFRSWNTWRREKKKKKKQGMWGGEFSHHATQPRVKRLPSSWEILNWDWKEKRRRRRKKERKKGNPCRCVTSTNHQFHIKPKTVLNTRPISIQAFLKPFGAFGALKGLIVPSSALH